MTSDEERKSMASAYERALEGGGSDVFGVLDDDDGPADLSQKPAFGPVEPPPPTPADVAPPPPGPPGDFEPYRPGAPATPAGDDAKSQRLAAIRRFQRMSDDMQAPPGMADSDIAAAQERDRSQTRRDNFTEALSAAIARRPARMQQVSEAPGLVQRRALADQQAQAKFGRESMVERMRDALLRPKGSGGGITPYQLEQLKRADADDEYRKKRDSEESKRSQSNIDATRDATKAQREFNQVMARLSLSQRMDDQRYKRERDIQEDVKDLGKTIGGEPEHLQGLIGRLKQSSRAQDIPGVGTLEGKAPDTVVETLRGEGALQNRNDMREAVRIMLSMKSGKTVTPQEAEDYARIYGISGSDDAFRQGVARLETDIADTIKAKKAGFTPAAVRAFEGQGGAPTPEKPKSIVAPQRPPDVPSSARFDGKTWKWRAPNGRVMVVDAE